MTENKAEKSLRWVVNLIPDFYPKSEEGKILLMIKRYCQAGADEIKRLEEENAKLKDKWDNLRCVYSFDGEVMEYCVNGPCPNDRRVSEVREENAALRARLEKAVELPRVIHPNSSEWHVQYQYESGIITSNIYYSASKAESRLAELKGERNDIL